MPAPYRRMQCTRGSPGGREAARRGGEGPGRGREPQAPGQTGGSDCVADGEGQADPEGLQNLTAIGWHPGARAARRAMCTSGVPGR